MVLTPTWRHSKRRGALPRQTILARRCEEWRSVLLRSRDFLQLYELSIEASNGDEKVMANWFPMALKDSARSWLLNLPQGSISSWDEMRDRFVANFQGTRDRPPATGDLRRIKQQLGETL